MENALDSWRDEKQAAYLYRVVAQKEKHPLYREMFRKLETAAQEQADIWGRKIKEGGGVVPQKFEPNLRSHIVASLVRTLGPRSLKPILAAMKVRGVSVYSARYRHPVSVEGHEMPRTLEDVGTRHKGAGAAGNLRAAVFGVNDGLVSIASLIMGVAGAQTDERTIVIAGVAGVLAGSFSMASGEFLSVKSQREMFEYQIGLEREELKLYPKEEAAELSLIYQARGLKKNEADRLSQQMIADPERGLDTLAREELGLDPEELVSPWGAALSSFLSFAAGGAVPLLSFLFSFRQPLAVGIGLTALSLFAVGAAMSLFTGRSALLSGLRMVLIGGGAGILTYVIGNALTRTPIF